MEMLDPQGYIHQNECSQFILPLEENVLRLRNALQETIHAISMVTEMRDPYTAGHERRVATLAAHIARGLGLSADDVEGIFLAATVHDVGKIAIPAEILAKPGKLSHIEFDLVKLHPRVGFDILRNIEFPWPVKEVVLYHHERFDGSGYPYGLTEKDIPLPAKVVAVADVVEGMSNHRPYRAALGIDMALEDIHSHRYIHYDADVVDVCMDLFQKHNFAFNCG